MKLLLNDKEIANFLANCLDLLPQCKAFGMPSMKEEMIVRKIIYIEKSKRKYNVAKVRDKFREKIRRAVKRDVREYFDRIKIFVETEREKQSNLIKNNLEYFIKKFGEEYLIDLYKNHKTQNFVKSVGNHLDPAAIMIRRNRFTDPTEDCLIRNTVGNEQLLVSKIDNNYPFWFIDSGYTNFLEPNKKYHRLVRNHLHYGNFFEAPVDRLGVFSKFPKQWRTDGEKILIIEPGPFAASIFHVDLKTWKYNVEAELRKYTDKPIVFREKINKKIRSNLYEELCNEDYYCVVNINSNAATESIWAGIPAITLDKHITNSITRNKLSDINQLIRPNISSWLCMLSYSQFTFNELIDGTAARIVKRYHV